MKISKQTLSIMSANAVINEGVVVQAGNVLQSESEGADAFVRAEVEETFPRKFAIADVGGFIRTLSLFDDPDITFHDNYMEISAGRNSCNYYYGEEAFIANGNWLTIDPKTEVLTFDLSWEDIQGIQKACGVLSLDQLEFMNNNGKVHCKAVSREESTDNIYGIDLSDCDPNIDFKLIMRKDIFSFYQGDYIIKVAVKDAKAPKVFVAQNKNTNITYQIAFDRKSEYNG